MQGKFIVIEGGDGAGKDTQIELLREDLVGDSIVWTRDPGGTALGNRLREIVQYEQTVSKEAELLLFLASRAQLVRETILPAIAMGRHVISNRFDLSTFAYQIHGRNRLSLKDQVMAMSEYARGEAIPDLLILLDIEPRIGHSRLVERGEKLTRFEEEDIQFHERVRAGYLEGANTYSKVRIIDANRPVEEVYIDVHAAVQDILKK
jgi:dTMP kinase